jgi:hypothetical protein
MLAMTTEDLQAAIAKEPWLNDNGIGFDRYWRTRMTFDQRCDENARLRDQMMNRVIEFSRTVDWLRNQKRTKHPNPRVSSYGLKHVMERQTGLYVTNGLFIAAAIHLGIGYKKHNSLNVTLALSSRAYDPKDRNDQNPRRGV